MLGTVFDALATQRAISRVGVSAFRTTKWMAEQTGGSLRLRWIALNLTAKLFQIEITLDLAKRIVSDDVAVAKIDDCQPLGQDHLTP